MGRNMQNMYEWRKKVQKRYEFYLNKETEADVMEWLEKQPNKREFLIGLIRKDMDEKRPSKEV